MQFIISIIQWLSTLGWRALAKVALITLLVLAVAGYIQDERAIDDLNASHLLQMERCNDRFDSVVQESNAQTKTLYNEAKRQLDSLNNEFQKYKKKSK